MASTSSFCVSPYLRLISETKAKLPTRVHSSGSGDSKVLSSDSFVLDRSSFVTENVDFVGGGNREQVKLSGGSKSRGAWKWMKDVVSNNLEVLWDDGYGTKTVKDYLDEGKEMVAMLDGGPPRWFCPIECGEPLKGSPILLFLPGIDGIGLGLILHHKALGKVFEVWCLHIPLSDRTSFRGLIKLVEETVRHEHATSPNKPIYLVGDSFGGCLALAVAARNPEIDLVLVLSNPATSFDSSQLQPILPILKAFPGELHFTVPYLLSTVLGNPLKMASVDIESKLPPRLQLEQMFRNLVALLPRLSIFADILPNDTFVWKLELLKSAADYTNSRLHAVKAEVLVLASGSDSMLRSGDEAQRLNHSLNNCIVRYFKDNGHTLLMEDGINLLTIIKGTDKYRCSTRLDYVADFIPPSVSEFKQAFDEVVGWVKMATGSAIFSTMDNGKIVKGLAGVPEEGPVLLVGYHMLMGIELYSLIEQFLKEKNIMVRGVAHPELFSGRLEGPLKEFSVVDWMRVMGALPVTGSNLFKLLSNKSHVLLYPGGQREALHYKGEEYKLFWPEQPEFVRMAARFGATIVPFGSVGEDDVAEYMFDYHDLMKVPVVNELIKEATKNSKTVRNKSQGEVGNPDLFLPIMVPKFPGRFYFLFGKPIRTAGMKEILGGRENANRLYLKIKSEVERSLAYLLKKREEDPYRNLMDRTLYRALYSPLNDVPTFDH